jgi:hypothetical protein
MFCSLATGDGDLTGIIVDDRDDIITVFSFVVKVVCTDSILRVGGKGSFDDRLDLVEEIEITWSINHKGRKSKRFFV